MSKFLDENGLQYFWSKLKTSLSNKVDKITGKGLSTEDYTTEEKNKLSGLSNYDDTTLSSRVDDLEENLSNVSLANDGTVSKLPSTTGSFLKNTGVAGGAWTKITLTDLPRSDVTGKPDGGVVTTYGEIYMTKVYAPYVDGDGSELEPYGSSKMGQLGQANHRWSRIYGVTIDATNLNTTNLEVNGSSLGSAAFSDSGNFIPISGSSSITGSLIPSTDLLSLGSQSIPWYNGFFKYVNTNSFYSSSGQQGGTITSHATLAPVTSTGYDYPSLGSITQPWEKVWAKSFGFKKDLTGTTKSGSLASTTLSEDRTWTFPNADGTICVTGNTSYTPTITSSTSSSYAIGTLKIGGSNVTIYGKDTVPTTTSSITSGSSALITSGAVYTGLSSKMNNSDKYTALTLTAASNFTIVYKAYLILGNFVYIDVDATATTTISANTSLTIATLSNYSSYKPFNSTSNIALASHNVSQTYMRAWYSKSNGQLKVHTNGQAIGSGDVIKFKAFYALA